MSADADIEQWLREKGYGLPGALARARAALEERGLTRPSKQRMSLEKVPRAQSALEERFALHCATAECVAWAKASGREPVPCDPKSTCERCGGSDNARAVRDLFEAAKRRRVTKLLVVGGSPSTREELSRLIGAPLELRMVDGTERRTSDRAKADLDWADVVLVWGASELHHKVSMQYTDSERSRGKMVHVAKRGIAQLLSAAVEHLQKP